ncbi:MAG: glycosyl transferase family 28 [Chitinophagaceae bacterium]|nr:MAG: glycosyl transferase family 28 [Chitinophagaceae bacterium]
MAHLFYILNFARTSAPAAFTRTGVIIARTARYTKNSQEQCHIDDLLHSRFCKITTLPPLFVYRLTKEIKINMDHLAASPKVLVAPLDWGLGHATRCIPIIRELINQGCEVILAGEGKAKALLQLEFPALSFLDLPGYRIEYASSGWGLAFKIVAQIPKLLSAIKEEQAWLEKIVEEEKIDAVISDNRFGLHNEKIYSVFITHQLLIKAPVKLAEDFLQGINYQYINKFDECWVPDSKEETNLAGLLSHPTELPSVPTHYVGPISRFNTDQEGTIGDELLILLSGPEPQRSLLEKQLLEELKEYTKPVVLVRGLPGEQETLQVNKNVSVFSHLPAAALEGKIKSASLVISRCGYSTVMDLATLRKKSILIPTPGQTEQEYLANHLMQKNFAFCVEQKKFRLKNALALAQHFSFQFCLEERKDRLQKTITRFVSSIQKSI